MGIPFSPAVGLASTELLNEAQSNPPPPCHPAPPLFLVLVVLLLPPVPQAGKVECARKVWAERRRLRDQKHQAMSQAVLGNLRAGGWGKKASGTSGRLALR